MVNWRLEEGCAPSYVHTKYILIPANAQTILQKGKHDFSVSHLPSVEKPLVILFLSLSPAFVLSLAVLSVSSLQLVIFNRLTVLTLLNVTRRAHMIYLHRKNVKLSCSIVALL